MIVYCKIGYIRTVVPAAGADDEEEAVVDSMSLKVLEMPRLIV
jgi:hypothetical protein